MVFKSLSFSELTLSGGEFEDCHFEQCDLSYVVLAGCKFINCHFLQCNLSLADISRSRFSDVVLKECKVVGVDWTKASWPDITILSSILFEECVLNDSSFFGLELKMLVVRQCRVHNVDFREGSFCNADFSSSDFLNSLFNQTDLSEADFSDSSNYHIDIYNNNINKAKFSRYEAVSLLEGLDIELVD